MSVQLPAHDPNTVTDSRVFINGRRIPVGDVDIHIRNEGPLDMGYYAEGEFPSPWQGDDYLAIFGIRNEDTAMDRCYIEIYRDDIGQYVPAFHGMVTGVGNAGGDDLPERMWKFRAQGPAFFLDKIPVGQNFNGVGNSVILEEIRSECAEKLPLNVRLNETSALMQTQTDSGEPLEAKEPTGEGEGFINRQIGRTPADGSLLDAAIGGTSEDEGTIDSLFGADDDGSTSVSVGGLFVKAIADEAEDASVSKRFTPNRHTLADVATWFSNKTDAFLYFDPRPDGTVLQPFFRKKHRSHKAHYLDGNVNVVANNALSEVNPINTLTINGKAAKSLFSLGGFDLQTPDNKYDQATARHEVLYNRAGQTELHATEFTETGATTKAEVEREARKRLYNRITETTEGDMETLLFHPITPHDSIEARPTCQSSPATDTEPLTYNVTRVHHKIRVNENSKTRLNVGIAVEDEDITTTSSTKKV